MAAKLIPALADSATSKACRNGEWEETVFDSVTVAGGAPGPGPVVSSIDYELNFAQAGRGMALWVEYSPATPGNTLTIGALWSTRGGTLFFPFLGGPSVVISSSSVIQLCCPDTPDFRLTLQSTGTGDDLVTAIICGTCGCCGGGGC